MRWSFEYSLERFDKQSAASRADIVNLFGTAMRGWELWQEIHTHTMWTAGQIVGNFRKHGMPPPLFTFF